MALGTEQNIQLLYALVGSTLRTDKYYCDRFDDDTTKYYGFVTLCGDGFYIMKETITGNVHTFNYYVESPSEQSYTSFETAWTGRAGLTYENIVQVSGKLK